MRNTTERQEGVEAGTARLVGTNISKIVNSVEILLSNKKQYDKMAKAVNPYGDGNTSKMIHNYILNA